MFLVCFMAMFCGTVMAQTTIWSEDWSGWEELEKKNPAGVNPNYTFTGTVLKDDGSFNSGTTIYKDKIAGGDAPELLIAKNGGSFTAKIAMNGVSGELKLSYKCNKALTITAENATIGEAQNSGNDYVYPVTVASGTSEISITFTMSTNANARLDNIKLYQGTAKKPAGLSWGTASRSVTLGAEDNNFPTLSNENNLSVTYSSSDTSVATINANGEITLIAAGKTEITAAFAGNDEYEEGKVSYTLTVNEKTTPAEITEITVAKALEITNALENGKTTTEEYKVKGFIVGTPDFQRRDDNTLYGNVNLTIADEKGGSTTLTIFRGKYFNDANFTEETITTLKEGDEVVFQGKLQKYVKGEEITPELTSCYLISVNGKTEPETPAVTIGETSDISEFIGIEEKGKPYKLTLENAQVVYAWTNSKNGNIQAFVRDETGALSFYFDGDFKSVGSNFVTNKIVNGTIIVNNEVYKGLPQASAIAETNTEKLTFTDGSEAQPVKITAADVAKNLNNLVLLENVTIEEKDGKYYVGDVQLYDQFGIIDLSSFVGEGKNVKGIAVVYNTTYEIYPIEITSQGGGETPATSGVMIKFTEEDVCAKGAAKSEYANGDFKLTCVDTKAEKLEIDANNAYFGTAEDYQKFTHRLKTGGKSGSSNSLTLTIPSDGTLKVYVRTGKNGETDRNLVLTQDGTELYNKVVQEADAVQVDMGGEEPTNVYPVISVAVKAGEVTIGYPVNSLNFYAFEFIAGSSGIQNVVKPVVENGIRYNLAGQRVDENYKGVVIMNGKKYVVK